jgi:hypothetical protein
MMDKEPLIGVSICAVVLLVLGSLSNVVGYQSVKSTAMNDSPLFSMRTKRAINQASGNILTSDYIGKELGNLLQFPIRDNRTESLIKAIAIISKMDDKTFERLTELCIQRAKQDKTLSDTTPIYIAQMLHQFRTKPETILNSFIRGNNPDMTSSPFYTSCYTVCHWFPGCIPIVMIFQIISFIVYTIYYILVVLVTQTSLQTVCMPPVCP